MKTFAQRRLEQSAQDLDRQGKIGAAQEVREIIAEQFGNGEPVEPLTMADIAAHRYSAEELSYRTEEIARLGSDPTPAQVDLSEVRTVADLRKITPDQYAAMGEDRRNALVARVTGGQS